VGAVCGAEVAKRCVAACAVCVCVCAVHVVWCVKLCVKWGVKSRLGRGGAGVCGGSGRESVWGSPTGWQGG